MGVMDLDRRTIHEALEFFATGRGYISQPSRGQVSYDSRNRELYSYGRHFPLVRYVPRALRGRGRPDLFVINGDEWRGGGWHPSRTPGHQSIVREACAGYDAETVILPFSAITGAGIELDSVRVVHVRADKEWTETCEARTLKELPRHERQTSYAVTLEARELEQVPKREQSPYRQRTAAELAELELEYGRELEEYERERYSYLPILADSDGMYRWTVTRWRDRAPDADGMYRWTERRHRLGDALISAIRPETVFRAARPFETETDTARLTVALGTGEQARGGHCESADDYRHVAGPSASCIYCGAELTAAETWRRRALYLSSFDLNEAPPLYFLAEVPRATAPDTVESALDALAPRAVHAAMARGRHVARQGDVFFIDTDLDRAELEARGARFARLTLWTRDAAPRVGEFGYVAPLTAAQRRRRATRERNHARRIFTATMRGELERDTWHVARELARELTRENHRARWQELLARQRAELEQVQGDTGALAPCSDCRAGAGAVCVDDCIAARRQWRATIGVAHERQRDELRRETSAPDHRYRRPETGAGGRRRARINRERARAELETARDTLRRAVFAGPAPTRYSPVGYRYSSPTSLIEQARARFETYSERVRTCELEPCMGARDSYRSSSQRAVDTWRRSLELAQRKYRPESVFDTDRWRARRELARRACAIYGTAHSATELAHVRGAVYVRGTVSHVPGLEPGRNGAPDHRPLTLTADRWYLAVRNAVPRQARRRRRSSVAP